MAILSAAGALNRAGARSSAPSLLSPEPPSPSALSPPRRPTRGGFGSDDAAQRQPEGSGRVRPSLSPFSPFPIARAVGASCVPEQSHGEQQPRNSRRRPDSAHAQRVPAVIRSQRRAERRRSARFPLLARAARGRGSVQIASHSPGRVLRCSLQDMAFGKRERPLEVLGAAALLGKRRWRLTAAGGRRIDTARRASASVRQGHAVDPGRSASARSVQSLPRARLAPELAQPRTHPRDGSRCT